MKNRYIWMAFGGFLIAIFLYFFIQLLSLTRTGQFPGLKSNRADISSARGLDKTGMQPVVFQNISEFSTENNRKMRLIGTADPNSVVLLLNRGARMRQIKVNPDGSWGVTLDIDGQAMAIEALMFSSPESAGIRSDEIIFSIPVPKVQDKSAVNYAAPALVMIGRSGGASRVIQSPFGQFPAQGSLVLSAVDYDDAGGVIFSGSASNEGRVRIYLNESAIGETGVQSDGNWTFTAGKLLPLGEYNIWAELIRPNETRERIGLVFERLPSMPQAVSDEGSLSVKFEPFRWQVRRNLVGGGSQSTVIFDPRGQIGISAAPEGALDAASGAQTTTE